MSDRDRDEGRRFALGCLTGLALTIPVWLVLWWIWVVIR